MSFPASQVHSVNPIGTDGIVRCYCNEPALLRTSMTERNPNRDYYVCTNRGALNGCKFYKWKDELDRLAQPPAPSQTQVPSPSQRQRADIARGSMTPSPIKQNHASTSAQTTPSRRFADIEAALAMSKGDAGKEKRPADIETGIALTSEPEAYSPPQTVAGSDDEDVFLSAVSSSPRSTHYHIHLPAQVETPRSPKRPRLEHSMNGNSSMLMTPPRSTGNDFRDAYMAPPESPSIGKRKEREGEEGELSQFQRIMRDPDHSFHERSASLKSASQFVSHQASPSSSSQNTVVSSNVTPELIKKLMNDVTSILPAYIAKLERKQVASEKSSEAKMRKIEELEKEITSLRNKNRVLEETVSALKARRPLS